MNLQERIVQLVQNDGPIPVRDLPRYFEEIGLPTFEANLQTLLREGKVLRASGLYSMPTTQHNQAGLGPATLPGEIPEDKSVLIKTNAPLVRRCRECKFPKALDKFPPHAKGRGKTCEDCITLLKEKSGVHMAQAAENLKNKATTSPVGSNRLRAVLIAREADVNLPDQTGQSLSICTNCSQAALPGEKHRAISPLLCEVLPDLNSAAAETPSTSRSDDPAVVSNSGEATSSPGVPEQLATQAAADLEQLRQYAENLLGSRSCVPLIRELRERILDQIETLQTRLGCCDQLLTAYDAIAKVDVALSGE